MKLLRDRTPNVVVRAVMRREDASASHPPHHGEGVRVVVTSQSVAERWAEAFFDGGDKGADIAQQAILRSWRGDVAQATALADAAVAMHPSWSRFRRYVIAYAVQEAAGIRAA
jgi:hypothetical protein